MVKRITKQNLVDARNATGPDAFDIEQAIRFAKSVFEHPDQNVGETMGRKMCARMVVCMEDLLESCVSRVVPVSPNKPTITCKCGNKEWIHGVGSGKWFCTYCLRYVGDQL